MAGISSRNFRRNSSLLEFGFVSFVLSAIPQETASHRSDTAGAGPHLLGMTDLRALRASPLMELPEPISGAIHDSQRERSAVLADKLDSQPFLISSTPTRGVQHLRVRIDAADHAEGFSVDFD